MADNEMDINAMLANLQRAHDDLLKIAEQDEATPFDEDTWEQRAEQIQDPVERLRFQANVLQMRNNALTTNQINLMMRRILNLEAAVLVLGQRVGQLTGEAD